MSDLIPPARIELFYPTTQSSAFKLTHLTD